MKAKKEVKQVRKVYGAEFKKQAIDRTQKDGVPVTAKDLGLHESQLHAWRQKARLNSQTTEEQKLQLGDNARLKRDVARLHEAYVPSARDPAQWEPTFTFFSGEAAAETGRKTWQGCKGFSALPSWARTGEGAGLECFLASVVTARSAASC